MARNRRQSDHQLPKPVSVEQGAGCGEDAVAPIITSEELLAGRREVLIQHGDELYRLRITRNGKLILHK